MIEESDQHINRQEALVATLQTLSGREQISLLLQATRSLSNRDRVAVFRAGGFSILRDRFLPILLHVLLKRILTGTVWWILCIVAVILILFGLTIVEHFSPQAVGPV